jgi:pyruvate kinase
MRSTKIVATVGPASREPRVLDRMVAAGMDIARLNFAHGEPAQHAETVERIRAASERVGRSVTILQDVPGPKLRIGPVAGGVVELEVGSRLVLTPEEIEGDANRLTVTLPGLSEIMQPSDVAYLADGSIRLRVQDVSNGEVVTEVEVGGTVASRQGLNLPNVSMALPAVSEDDHRLIDAGIDMGVDLLALSFVRAAADLDPVRRHLEERDAPMPVIAKIEKPQAAEDAEAVVAAADGIMVARGDLGIELPIEQVPLVQKRLLKIAGAQAKPAITATQMLESMVSSSRPTRAEVADVCNAIFDGTDAVMLSQETAIGRDPAGAVKMMAAIADATERELPYGRMMADRGLRSDAEDQAATIAFGAVGAVYRLGLKALVAPTMTGRTARLLAAHRPNVPILALSMNPKVVRELALVWGVCAEQTEEPQEPLELIDLCGREALRLGLVQPGDKIGITAGVPTYTAGGTNLFKVHTVGE